METGKTDKTLQLLKLLAGLGGSPGGGMGLRNVTIKTSEPDDVTLVMEGTTEALDLDIFEVPVDLYPLRAGDRLLAYPLVSTESGRWALLAKLNGGPVTLATMNGAASCQPDGSQATLANLVIPYGLSLNTGDRVAITPTFADGQLYYVILNRY